MFPVVFHLLEAPLIVNQELFNTFKQNYVEIIYYQKKNR